MAAFDNFFKMVVGGSEGKVNDFIFWRVQRQELFEEIAITWQTADLNFENGAQIAR